MAKLLQGLGVLALLGLIGGSVAALFLVKQRIVVTIADEAQARHGPDPLELLRADVGAVQGDVQALSQGLAGGLEALHGSIEDAAAERERALQGEIRELRERLAALQARLDGMALAAPSPAAPAPQGAELSPAAPAVVASEPTTTPLATAPAPDRTAEAPPSAPAPKKKSFLSFGLPSESFAFDQPMRFAIVPSLSRVGFDAKSTLHDFSGASTKVEGELSTCLARPQDRCQGEIRVAAASLDTGEADRDVDMRKSLGVEAAPTLRFEWTAFTLDALDASSQKLSGSARGRLSLHGKTRELSMPVRVSVDASKRVVIEGETTLKMSDFGVEPPSKLGVIKVEDEVKIWIALRARSLGPAEESK